jgi:hypothetical protein
MQGEVWITVSTISVPKPCNTFNNTRSCVVSNQQARSSNGVALLDDTIGDLEIVDMRCFKSIEKGAGKDGIRFVVEDLPTKISGTYTDDYNIVHVDDVIRKKLNSEKYVHLEGLRNQRKYLSQMITQPQTYIMRESTLQKIKSVTSEIEQIETGEKLRLYNSKVSAILAEYKRVGGSTKVRMFEEAETKRIEPLDEVSQRRVSLIERYLDIAADYIELDIVRLNDCPSDLCTGCGASLANVVASEDGTIRCINPECCVEHNMIINTKMSKDSARVSSGNNINDESIDNFLRSFICYNGLQTDIPDQSLYDELDEYFMQNDRPTGEEIRELPLNERGRRGDTTHEMLWYALSQIGRSDYYKDTNLIGHVYWGWLLPDTMQFREKIISDYHKTQKVFYKIPPEERGRDSSLGTQYRLWRHLQLVGYECYMDEFKIAENQESIRTHNRLWRMMCEGANDPNIYYIE